MQASTASNETRLPRQILKRSAAIDAHLQAKREANNPAAPGVPPATGTDGAATTAEPTSGMPPAQPADPRENDPAYWKQRFKVAEGRLTAQQERHREQTDALTLQISELMEQVQTLQANAPVTPTDVSEFLTPEQVALLGADEAQTIVDAVLKGARKEVAKLVDAEIKPLREAQTATRARTQEDVKREFLEKLEELVPEYAAIDVTDGWQLWLAEDDEATGLPRQEALNHHMGRANASGVAKLFNAYLAQIPKPPAPPVAANGSGAGAGAPPAQPTGAAGYRPSPAEITTFFKRKSTIRKGQPGYVTEQEAIEFEKRLKLPPRR